ncbi:MAG: hypothetical protein ACXVB9_19835 [Bdellovibrionota bacterium]
MKYLSLLVLLAATPVHAEPSFKGYEAVAEILTERLLADGSEFSFHKYLKSPGDKVDTSSLLNLLGSYDKTSGTNQFRNGDPNSVSMLLWQLLLQLTGKDVADRCRGQGIRVNPIFQAALDPICKWPSPEAQSDSSLRGFWTSVMGYDAPEEEFLAWKQFALSSSFANRPASEAVPAFFFLITINPHFLLRE